MLSRKRRVWYPGASYHITARGILFLDELDELDEFTKKTLDMLRQPLENGKVTISRAH